MEVTYPPTCDHSTKEKQVKDFSIWLCQGQIDRVAAFFEEDISWTLVGEETFKGKDAVVAAFKRMMSNPLSKLNIQSVISDGQHVSVQGEMMAAGPAIYAFADFYEFRSAGSLQVKSIKSFIIELKDTDKPQ